jgi:hypothetical protein
MSYSRTQAQGAASTAKTQMGGQSQKSQSSPEARPPDSKFEPFPVYTITTLMESMARATLDEGFAGRGELILFYGPPKHGKAFLASQFAVSVAVGANWFGSALLNGSERPGKMPHPTGWQEIVSATAVGATLPAR